MQIGTHNKTNKNGAFSAYLFLNFQPVWPITIQQAKRTLIKCGQRHTMAWLAAVNMNIRLPALTPNNITWFEGLQASPTCPAVFR
jgi:hypothetical protein